jgi:acylphosphatase
MRLRVVYSGHVQGVGFRYSVEMIAGNLEVRGYVQNQYDGSVELVVEGNRAEIRKLLDEIQSTRGRNISSVSEFEELETGEFHDFHIGF